MYQLSARQKQALADVLKAQAKEQAAHDRFITALHKAVEAGVPKTRLSATTGMPRQTLLRRLAATQDHEGKESR